MILIGEPLTELPRGVIKTPSGWRTVYKYRGIRSACEGLVQQLAAQFDEVELDPIEGDYCEVRAFNNGPEDGQQEGAVVTVELRGALVDQSYEFAPEFANLTDADLHHINRILADVSSSDASFNPQSELELVIPTTNNRRALASFLFSLKKNGIETYKAATHYLTRTLSVSAGYPRAVNTTNLNKLWTAEQISNYIGSQTLFNIGTLTPSTKQTNLGFGFYWHQQQAEAVITSSGGWQLVEGWQAGFARPDTYGLATFEL